MSQKTDQQANILEQYRLSDIPQFGAAQDAVEPPEARVKTGDDEFITISVGDIIKREHSGGGETRLILEAYTHGFVTWVLEEKRYSYYPREIVEEDIGGDTYETLIVNDLLGVWTNQSELD